MAEATVERMGTTTEGEVERPSVTVGREGEEVERPSVTVGREGKGEVEKPSVTLETLQAIVSSQTVQSVCKDSVQDGAAHSGVEKKKRLGFCGRVVVCCLRKLKLSPVRMLRKVRDCYVNSLGNCAQSYISHYPPYGVMSCHGSPLPPGLAGRSDDLLGSEFGLSPAFMKSFNDALMKTSGGGGLADSDPSASPFRKSFSDYESCVSPQMQRTYSDAAALYARSPGNSRSGSCCRRSPRSPGWTPTRTYSGQAMMIFPIQEDPELILASFRKEANDLKLAAFRKDNMESEAPLKKDAELPSLAEETFSADPSLSLKENPEACHALTPASTVA